MAKFAGNVGFTTQSEVKPGVWEQTPSEKKMRGDILRLGSSIDSGDKINDDITLSNRFSLIGDPFSFANFQNMKYVEYLGQKWKVITVEVNRPRLIVSVGGVWNG